MSAQLNALIAPYLAKAREFAAAGLPVAAYYCRFYAVSLALKGGTYVRNSESDAILAQQFELLEKEKSQLAEEEGIKSPKVGANLLRSLAFRLFLSAERDEQQATTASIDSLKVTMERYLGAVRVLQVYRGLFLDSDASFAGEIDGDLEEELAQVEEKSKFAKWRAVELKKAIVSGDLSSVTSNVTSKVESPKVINTSNPSNTSNTSNPSNTSNSSNPSTTSTTSTITSPHQQSHQQQSYNLPLQQPIFSISTPTPSSIPTYTAPTSPPQLTYDPKLIAEAEKQAKFAISALHFDDLPTAITNLQRAIDILRPLVPKSGSDNHQ